MHGKLPEAEDDCQRVLKASEWLKWENDALYILKKGSWLMVPAVATRIETIEERHVLLRHAGINKLLASLKGEYWW